MDKTLILRETLLNNMHSRTCVPATACRCESGIVKPPLVAQPQDPNQSLSSRWRKPGPPLPPAPR